jgi:two-component system NarL family response regulator
MPHVSNFALRGVFPCKSMILIASATPETLCSWERALEGLATVLTARHFEALNESVARLAPRVMLLDLDLPGLDGARGVATLRSAAPATRLIAFAGAASDDLEVALFKLGVRGCARRDIEPQLIKRIVVAIEQGELWMRRSITSRLLDELSARFRAATNSAPTGDQLAMLTQREREIVKLIGSGESNKQIARALCITERTVKAHLTGIFRKLGVADRVRLALRVASRPDYRSEWIT